MCCFSGPVKSVSATNIFARMESGERQLLVYRMSLETDKAVAMVLPLPVAKGSTEKALRFINLQKYPNFFDDLEVGFPAPVSHSANNDGPMTASKGFNETLTVYHVGDFEASFVPSVKDFDRLDKQFRLPPTAFKKLPGYKNFGFAVFKLKAGAQHVHPMAFEFRTDLPTRLFFPTVHIHDGQVHAEAEFDHKLYCQPSEVLQLKMADWEESPSLASKFMDVKKTGGIIVAEEHCYKHELRGMLPNRDTFAEART